MVKTFATNMGVWAEALKVQKVKQQARHGVAYDLPESIKKDEDQSKK